MSDLSTPLGRDISLAACHSRISVILLQFRNLCLEVFDLADGGTLEAELSELRARVRLVL